MADERLQKILSRAGVASRRKAEELMAEGRVTVNGKIITELGTKADLDTDYIKVDGRLLHKPKNLIYLVISLFADVTRLANSPSLVNNNRPSDA